MRTWGGRFHFTSHLGVSYRLRGHFGAGYRIQHMFNADIEDPNPGLDLHMLELRFGF